MGRKVKLDSLVFKRYPTCWSTTSSIDAVLALAREKLLTGEEIDRIDVKISPYPHSLVGHAFTLSDNPRVCAQYSLRYCVASALIRKRLELENLEERAIRDPKIMALLSKIDVMPDPESEKVGHNAAVIGVRTKGGDVFERIVVEPRGGPGNPLTDKNTLNGLTTVSAMVQNPCLERIEKRFSP
jgi:2-methylcitrate dehydratase PrpD